MTYFQIDLCYGDTVSVVEKDESPIRLWLCSFCMGYFNDPRVIGHTVSESITYMYSCGQRFSCTHQGTFGDFCEPVFIQGGIVLQHSSLMTDFKYKF